MNGFIKKILDSLLKKTENLTNTLEDSATDADPLQKKIQNLREKRDLLKTVVTEATNPQAAQNETQQTQSLKETISESLAAKQAVIKPAKRAKNKRPNKRRG